MKRWLKRIAMVLVGLCIVVSASTWWAFQKTREVPEFYARAIRQLPADHQKTSETLEHEVVQLQDAASKMGSWQATFSEEQINAWFVQQFPREFPSLLPQGVQDPRIVIEDGRVLAAAKYVDKRIDTVVSFEIRVELTEQPNVLAVRIENLRAGALRLPLQGFLRGISAEAAKGEIEVVWETDESGPVALVTVPRDHPGYARSPVIIESVNVEVGKVLLAGHTGEEAIQAYQPKSSVYQLASLRVGKKVQSQELSGPSVLPDVETR